jgi:hypothetical protein
MTQCDIALCCCATAVAQVQKVFSAGSQIVAADF